MTLAPRANVNQFLLQPEITEAVFTARELSKAYRMGDIDVHALRSVNLELYKGELVVLLGASGSGKSTLLNILGGLDVPTSGNVFYRDVCAPLKLASALPSQRKSTAVSMQTRN